MKALLMGFSGQRVLYTMYIMLIKRFCFKRYRCGFATERSQAL
jgi:hypothetical protein